MGTHIPSQKSRRVRQETVSKLKQMSMQSCMQSALQMNKTMKLIDYTDGPALHYYSDGSRVGAALRPRGRGERAVTNLGFC